MFVVRRFSSATIKRGGRRQTSSVAMWSELSGAATSARPRHQIPHELKCGRIASNTTPKISLHDINKCPMSVDPAIPTNDVNKNCCHLN